MRRRTQGALLVLLLLAAGLRLWGLGFGLPGIAHDDEWQYAQQGVSMLSRWSPRVTTDDGLPYLNPTGFKLITAAFCLPLDAWKAGGAPGGPEARARYKADRGAYHLAGRLASALFGVAGVLLTFLAGREVAGSRAALAGAALLALSPLHVRDSHFATNDVATSAILAAGLWLLARAWRRPTLRSSLALGVVLGAGCATKYSAGLFLGPVLVVLLIRGGDQRARLLVQAGAGALGAFLLLCPAVFLDTEAFLRSFLEQASYGKQPWPGQDPGLPAWLHLVHLQRALGVGGLCLAAAGLVLWLRRGRYELLAYPALHLVFFLPLPLFFARFDLPLLPFLCVAAACALGALGRRIDSRALALVVAALLFAPAHDAVRLVHVLSRPDTRLDLRSWLEERLEAGEHPALAVDRGVFRFLPRSADGADFDPRLGRVFLLSDPPPTLEQLRATCDYLVVSSYLRETLELPQDPAALVLRVDPARSGAHVPYAHEERYGPWDHIWARARAGPTVTVYALRQ